MYVNPSSEARAFDSYNKLLQKAEKERKNGDSQNTDVYKLITTQNGAYPDVRYGIKYMKAGDIWKYGTTANGTGRYAQRNLDNLYLKQITIYKGTTYQALAQEKMLLIQHGQTHGDLPPGNKFYK